MSKKIITECINQRKMVTFIYGDAVRMVEPHSLGMTSSGEFAVRAYQVGDSPEVTGWRLFKLDNLSGATNVNLSFSPRSDYRKGDKVFTNISAEV